MFFYSKSIFFVVLFLNKIRRKRKYDEHNIVKQSIKLFTKDSDSIKFQFPYG